MAALAGEERGRQRPPWARRTQRWQRWRTLSFGWYLHVLLRREGTRTGFVVSVVGNLLMYGV